MKIGDLIKFRGTWGPNIEHGERRFGIVMQVWKNSWSNRIQTVEILWDNGDYGTNHSARSMEVISDS
mgnify:CR=1 FL=1